MGRWARPAGRVPWETRRAVLVLPVVRMEVLLLEVALLVALLVALVVVLPLVIVVVLLLEVALLVALLAVLVVVLPVVIVVVLLVAVLLRGAREAAAPREGRAVQRGRTSLHQTPCPREWPDPALRARPASPTPPRRECRGARRARRACPAQGCQKPPS